MVQQQQQQPRRRLQLTLTSLPCLFGVVMLVMSAATTVKSFEGPAVITRNAVIRQRISNSHHRRNKIWNNGGTLLRSNRNPFQPLIPLLQVSLSDDSDVERLFGNDKNKYQDEGVIDPTPVTTTSTFATKNTQNQQDNDEVTKSSGVVDPTKQFLQEKLFQAGFLAVVALASYGLVTYALTATMDVATTASHALGDEILHEIASVAKFIFSLFLAFFELVKVVLPIVGKGLVAAGKAAAPVVQETSYKIAEVATPYVQEAARSLNEVAAPYVDSVTTAVDTSIVTPVLDAVDANIVTPLDDVRTVVTTSVDATLNEVSQTVSTTIQGVTDGATNTVKDAVTIPMQGMTDSVKEATRSMRDLFPF